MKTAALQKSIHTTYLRLSCLRDIPSLRSLNQNMKTTPLNLRRQNKESERDIDLITQGQEHNTNIETQHKYYVFCICSVNS